MKTYNERTASILEKVKVHRKRRNIIRASVCGVFCSAILILGINLFTPYDTTPPNMEQYAASEYYSIIQKINTLTYKEPEYKNPFEQYVLANIKDYLFSGFGGASSGMNGSDRNEAIMNGIPLEDGNLGMPEPGMNNTQANSETTNPDNDPNYEETTDNQVSGVIEGDRFKRSDKYIYYVRNNTLTIYSIEGENSKEVGCYTISNGDGYNLKAYEDEWEIFLSSDCKTITLVSSAYHTDSRQKHVALVNIDVSDPTQIKETQRTYLTGSYLSARMVDGDLLLMAYYNVKWHDIDFDDASTFVPMYGTAENMECIDSSNIVTPEELATTNYTVICKIDAATLEAKSTGAFLSYADEVYVSTDKIYASRSYSLKTSYAGHIGGYVVSESMTEISAMTYTGEELEPAGSVHIAGYLENQYSMDEYEGILRVVTTTNAWRTYNYNGEYDNISTEVMIDSSQLGTNASLYCIDLETWKVVASVEKFAPAGETVRSVRFDKNNAYVCTAVQLTDPVFYFDLSDLNNITMKDTGTITGYSISLVNFGDYLLGIGYGDSMETLKIELYQETPTGVESVCAYEVYDCGFSTEYKSYLIDRENMRIGLGYQAYTDYKLPDCYVLLQFDGYDFIELVKEPITGENAYKRAVIIDGYLYMFGDNFIVKEL